MTGDDPAAKRSRNACPYCGEPLKVGFGDFLPTKGRSGPVRLTCSACRGTARLATSAQIMAVVGFVVGLLGGAIAGARVGATTASDQSTLIVLALAAACAFLLSFVMGWAFLRLDPDGDPPSVVAKRERAKRGRRGKR
jgi:hypothetical protein